MHFSVLLSFIAFVCSCVCSAESKICQEYASKLETDKGELWDLHRPLEGSCKMKLLKFDDPEGQHCFWHSSAHILGTHTHTHTRQPHSRRAHTQTDGWKECTTHTVVVCGVLLCYCLSCAGQCLEAEYGSHLTVGPALTSGFYYDCYMGDTVSATQHQPDTERGCFV